MDVTDFVVNQPWM